MGDEGHQSNGQQGRRGKCYRKDLLLGAEGRDWFWQWAVLPRVWLARMVSQEHSLKSSSSQWRCVQMQSQGAEHRQD